MKSIINNLVLACVCAAMVFQTSCKKNIDLGNVDLTTSVETSLSLPLGTFGLKLGDFLGDSTIQGVYIDEHGEYLYADTMSFDHKLDIVDINDFVHPVSYTFDFAEHLQVNYPHFDNLIIPAGQTLDFTFPIDLSMKHMNADWAKQHLDSIVASHISFITSISLEGVQIAQQDIQVMEVEIVNGFRCQSGNKIVLPFSQYGFNKDIPLELNDVHVVLMKDAHQAPAITNVLDTISINLHMQLHTSSPINFSNAPRMHFQLRLDQLKWDAVYGYIHMPNLLQDSIIDRPIVDMWAGWEAFDGTILPLNRPSLLFTIEHGFSVPLAARLNTFNVSTYEGEYTYATFDGEKSKTFHFPSKIALDAPYSETTIDSIRIDYQESNGNIDELLTIHPDRISYDYQIGIDSTSAQQQFRITNNMDLKMALAIHVPFEFDSNVHFAYHDTIHDVDLTTLQLDSLLAKAEFIDNVEEAELKLHLDIENTIPFNIEGRVQFFTEDGEVIQLASMEEDAILLSLKQPEVIVDGLVQKPSTNKLTLNIEQSDFDKIAATSYIVFYANLKDNNTVVKLTPKAAITIKAGISAYVKATVDINGML